MLPGGLRVINVACNDVYRSRARDEVHTASMSVVGTACLDLQATTCTPLPGPLTRPSQTADRELSPSTRTEKRPGLPNLRATRCITHHRPIQAPNSPSFTRSAAAVRARSQKQEQQKPNPILGSLFAQRLPACTVPVPCTLCCTLPLDSRSVAGCFPPLFLARLPAAARLLPSPGQRRMVSTTIATCYCVW